MSFVGHKEAIGAGDTVVLHFNNGSTLTMSVKAGETHQTRLGQLPHSSLIGMKYGTKISFEKGWLHVLHPTPELWAANLPHKCRLLSMPDIGMISLQLDLKPGSVVVESGNASVSLSHAVIRTIQPGGHLYMYEADEEQVEKFKEEFTQHYVKDHVSVIQRDVCKQGFDQIDIADAVFLHVDEPWLAVESVKQVLKAEGGRFCSFSPNMEEVQKTCEILKQHGFHDLRTIECLEKNFEITSVNLGIPYLGFDRSTEGTTGCVNPLKRESKDSGESPGETKILKMDESKKTEENPTEDVEGEVIQGGGDNSNESKEDVTVDPESEENVVGEDIIKESKNCGNKKGKPREYYLDLIGKKQGNVFSFKTESALSRTGHTGYLTFATLQPADTDT